MLNGEFAFSCLVENCYGNKLQMFLMGVQRIALPDLNSNNLSFILMHCWFCVLTVIAKMSLEWRMSMNLLSSWSFDSGRMCEARKKVGVLHIYFSGGCWNLVM